MLNSFPYSEPLSSVTVQDESKELNNLKLIHLSDTKVILILSPNYSCPLVVMYVNMMEETGLVLYILCRSSSCKET